MPQNIKLFNDLYAKYYKKTYHISLMYVRNDQVAEDIATDSFVKLWETMQKGNIEKPLILLLTIIKHKSLDFLKTQMNHKEKMMAMAEWQQRELSIRISTLEGCNPEDIFSVEIHSILSRTLKGLPQQTQNIFRMSRFEQKSGKEIAEALNISVKGVDYHIAKALKALRISLKDYLPLFSFFVFLAQK